MERDTAKPEAPRRAARSGEIPSPRLNVLVLYDDRSTHINTVWEHLQSWAVFSRHSVYYAVATNDAPCGVDLSLFDVIVIHYSVRLSLDWHLSPPYADALRKSDAFKILFIQDEYDTPETARGWMESLAINAVFTCVPRKHIDAVYPSQRFPDVQFVETLTGFVPIGFETPRPAKPMSERKYMIGYRGRVLAHWYGDLAREKLLIGQKMKRFCEERGVPASIEWEEDKRIYGDAWYEFLGDCRAVLGTESGSNVFDDRGEIRTAIKEALSRNPFLTYEEIHRKFLAAHDGRIRMNQVSPRVFETIAVRSALVLFEGTYSGVVKPDRHFIPLKKDLSNADEVLERLKDCEELEKMTERAYRDVIASGKFGYAEFVRRTDEFLSRNVPRSRSPLLVTLLAGRKPEEENANLDPATFSTNGLLRSKATNFPLAAGDFTEMETPFLSAAPRTRHAETPAAGGWILRTKRSVARALSHHPHLEEAARVAFRRVRTSRRSEGTSAGLWPMLFWPVRGLL
ncbi:MAG: hypothetical protein ACYTAF_16635, partial [Planctomycetota bacterium]